MLHQADVRYKSLTPQQQTWLDHFAEFKMPGRAYSAAYPTTPEDKVNSLGSTMVTHPKIAPLIKEYLTPRTDLPTVDVLRELYMDLYNSPSATIREKLQALTAYERVSGYSKPTKSKDDDGFNPSIDDING